MRDPAYDRTRHEIGAAREKRLADLVTKNAALVKALNSIVEQYCDLANSGDAGFWDPEKVPQVIAARAALARHDAGYPELAPSGDA
jgi:hypothetical protein